MISISPVFAAAHRLSPGLPVLGLALLAGLSWAPNPAAAASAGWQNGCQFKTIPGSGGEGLRYDECLRLETCQQMANAAGRTIFEAGCFGIAPDAPVHPVAARLAR
ncbi:hypothetical protein ASE61_09315 [Bosea sp. Root670]|uniref:hypothetical protein n=1 Tax=Bosea sp. Root670 TaxID=1736583 RepID=UPI000715173D|nr:hypothetical protein [Bosea sp. Root670]KRE03817.1 hypothetical protein ASE61_09315 [Bosea sp. Root670]